MKHRLAALALLLAVLGARPVLAQPVVVVPLEGAIGPAAADFVKRSIERAAKEGDQLVVLRMDTPGGLDTSMREIIKAILASPVPVASFVAPSGARAASAGTYILYASHIAAMAPGTNLGAASPVFIGGGGSNDKDKKGGEDTLTKKATNDAVAYIRGFAQMRHRNAQWAEKAVREAVSLPADEALKMKVIDVVAPDVPALLKAVDGRLGLKTANAPVHEVEPDWRTRFLAVITNPSIAYILVLAGAYALLFEFLNPGLVLPGVVGAIAILIALYALHLLPVNYAGLALMFLGIGFMVAEVFLPSFGSLGIGGLIAFVVGSIMLIEDTSLPGFEIPYAVIGGVAAASAAFLFFVIGMLARSRRAAVVTGREQMIGAEAEALEDFAREGWARVRGERWKVRSAGPVRRGERLRVKAIDGLILQVVSEGDN
ncbi:MAG TPA: nodulation protein NfeD [Burkholderiales bacterium]|nr:nodulation protein NfeD [Burkholderiales bacterium]